MATRQITITELASSGTYDVAHEFSPSRVLVWWAPGVPVLADIDPATGQWRQAPDPPNEAERQVIHDLIQANGGFDNTQVTVTKDGG
jgi:hypothetical protein